MKRANLRGVATNASVHGTTQRSRASRRGRVRAHLAHAAIALEVLQDHLGDHETGGRPIGLGRRRHTVVDLGPGQASQFKRFGKPSIPSARLVELAARAAMRGPADRDRPPYHCPPPRDYPFRDHRPPPPPPPPRGYNHQPPPQHYPPRAYPPRHQHPPPQHYPPRAYPPPSHSRPAAAHPPPHPHPPPPHHHHHHHHNGHGPPMRSNTGGGPWQVRALSASRSVRCLECLTGAPRAHREEEEGEGGPPPPPLGKSTLAPTAAGGPPGARPPAL